MSLYRKRIKRVFSSTRLAQDKGRRVGREARESERSAKETVVIYC